MNVKELLSLMSLSFQIRFTPVSVEEKTVISSFFGILI